MAELTGKIHSSAVVSLSGTTAVALWVASLNRKAKLRKILIYNADTADAVVEIGEADYSPSTGAATWSSQKLPAIPVASGAMVTLGPNDIPEDSVYTSDASSPKCWAARLQAAVTANPVQIKIEVEEA